MFQNLYNAVKEPFVTPQEFQTNFYQDQQNRFQGVEPNRILPDTVPTNMSASLDAVKAAVRSFDPYTQASKVPFNDQVLTSLVQGSPAQSSRVTECRQYVGLAGLEQMIQANALNPNEPVRCGFRYRKSAGVVPLVAQGAYGTAQGPISQDSNDTVGGDVQWIWDLELAKKRLLTDSGNNLASCSALGTLPALENGTYNGKLGFCKVSNKFIPMNNGKVAYPSVDTLNCPADQIASSAAQCPTVEGFYDTAATDQACLASGSASLTRDCLLRAVQMAGCSDQGSMYTALQGSTPGGPFDVTLKTQKAFQDFQSAQGAAAITQNLFRQNTGTMNMALQEVGRVKTAMQSSPSLKVKKAAEDLCLRAGIYDTYDFCADIVDQTPIAGVEFSCVQQYWQKKNGKPAGTAYPMSATSLSALGNPTNWKLYKQAVDALEQKTRSTNATEQRQAFLMFYGIQPGPTPQLRVPLDASTKGVETIWFDSDLTHTQRGSIFCVLTRQTNLSSQNMALPVIAQGTAPVAPAGLATKFSFQAFWDFRVGANTRAFWKIYTGDPFRITVNQPLTDFGNNDTMFSRFTDQGSATFQTNTNTQGLLLSSEKPNIMSLEYQNTRSSRSFSTEFALQAIGTTMPALTPLFNQQGILNSTWKDTVVLTQEITAPYIALEVCKRTINNPTSGAYTAENGKIAFQDRRLFSRGLELQKNGRPTFQVTADKRISTPGNVPYVSIVDGQSFVSFSKVAFQALKTFTLCFRLPTTLTVNQTVSLFSWVNLENGYTQRIGYTFTAMNDGTSTKVSVEIKGSQGTTNQLLPGSLVTGASAPWYLLVGLFDQFEGNTQGITFVLDTAANFAASGSYPLNTRVSIPKPSSIPAFFGSYVVSKQNRGELRFGGVGSVDIAWFHGFDYKVEEGEQLKREGRSGWIRTWYEADT